MEANNTKPPGFRQRLVARLWKSHLFWQTLAGYWDRFFGLLLSVILARIIDPEIFGVFAVGCAIAQLTSLPTRWDLGALMRTDAYYREEGFPAIWQFSKKLLRIELFLILSVTGALYFYGKPSGLLMVILIAGAVTAFDKFIVVLRGDLEGQGKFRQNLTNKIAHTVLCFAIGIPVAMLGYGLSALTIMLIFGIVVNWYVLRRVNNRDLSLTSNDKSIARRLRRQGTWVWLNQLANISLLRGDKILLTGVESMESIAYYSRGLNFSPISFMAFGSLCGESAIVAISKIEDDSKRFSYIMKRLAILLSAGVVNALVWIFFAEEIIGFVFGEKWVPAVPYFKLFAGLALVQSFYGLAQALLYGTKHFKAMAIIKLCAILAGCGGIILFGINYQNVAIGLQVTMCIAAILMIVFFATKPKITPSQVS